MSSKEEVAALMATGNAETKISLLKKAVVSVTKQKQLLEQHNQQLQTQMVTIGEELANAQEENKTLQRRVRALEADLEAERGRRDFVKSTWKGLSSLVTGADGETRAKPALSLSSEAQEKLITENEGLHMQLFDARTRADDAQRRASEDTERLERECVALRAEAAELRGLLDTAARACDALHADRARHLSLAEFCRHFFAPPTSPRVPPRCDGRSGAAAGALRALLSGTAALVVSLRESARPSERGGTRGEWRARRERLAAFAAAHASPKAAALGAVEAVVSAAGGAAEEFVRAQSALLAALDAWLALLALHARLVADTCGAVCGAADAARLDAAAETVRLVAAMRGAMEALRLAAARAPNDASGEAAEVFAAWESFWWEGCAAAGELRAAAAALAERLQRFAETAPTDALRAALRFLAKSLATVANGGGGSGPHFHPTRSSSPARTHTTSEETNSTRVPSGLTPFPSSSGERDEVVEALAAADRAAVCYYTQLNHALLELAEKEMALESVRSEERRLQSVLEEQREEALRVREALETQIRLLSDQLVECNNGAN